MKVFENILIIIDPWMQPDNFSDKLYSNIILFLNNNTTLIDTLVLASYEVPYAEHLCNDIWRYNYNGSEIFHEQKNKYWETFDENMNKNIEVKKTEPRILNYENKNYNQIVAQFPNEIDKINEVKNVYFAGSSLEICVRNRPLGYQYFVENTKCNIFIKPELLGTMQGMHPTMNENWIELENFFMYHRYYHDWDWED